MRRRLRSTSWRSFATCTGSSWPPEISATVDGGRYDASTCWSMTWSEAYDRALADTLKVEDDSAGELTKA
jgi:hypothetical protein